MNCSNCGFINDRDAVYCENCGKPLKRTCAHCGSPLKSGAKFCKQCGSPVSTLPLSSAEAEQLTALRQSAPPELKEKIRTASLQDQGERKPVTILFTDIVGSTALAEKLDPEEWKEIVSGAHQRVSQAVYRYEGTIAQLLGDGVLAFFGAPVTHEDDPVRAVRAALDIQAAIKVYAHELRGYVDDFQVRVGLNSGTVVVGSVGSDLHMEYLAIGDAVNLAARLQSAAQPGKVLISESTARLVRAACELQSLGEISVKGKTEPVTVFEVVAIHNAPGIRRGFDELRSPLVGRESELAALQHAFQQLSAGFGQIVSITGEAGIGKSRLVEEACLRFLDPGSSPCNLRFLEGRALSYGEKLSFWTIRQLLQADLGLSDGDPEVKQRLALRKRVQALFGEEANQALPYLSSLLGVHLEGELADQVYHLDGETLKHQTLLSTTSYFSHLAAEQPTVLVFDDLHWADPSSLEALERLLPMTDRVPILLLMMSRLEREHPSWQTKLKAASRYAHRYTEIELKPLTTPEQNRLVDNLLDIADLPEVVRKRILERAEGNPLFLEEIVRDLIERGAIVRDGEHWRATSDILSLTIPETLKGVLLGRIDRLQEDVRRTLQLASVIGKSFLYRLLEAIAEAEAQLEGHLAQLQRTDLVREKARLPELEYIFKHSLTQEAAYHSLLLEQRREFHRKVGETLENQFAERKEEFYGLLAHHFDAAGDVVKAINYLIWAGDKARLSDEHMEAVGYYQRAVELLAETGDDERSAGVWLKLGLVYHANFQFDATYHAYETAFALDQKTRLQADLVSRGLGETLRISRGNIEASFLLDPGKAHFSSEAETICDLFAGLAKVDEKLNVIPDVARSWHVLDGGQRYIFHLRDDVRWTDGAPVTAADFEWAWKRNLNPEFDVMTAQYLYAVQGAQDYHQGRQKDPDGIGVRAMDALTLEVNLVKPVAYFPYIVTLPPSFPLPRQVIGQFGKEWWRPEHIVSNGAFRLVEIDQGGNLSIERNPGYHGAFPGNVQRVEWRSLGSENKLSRYQDNNLDVAYLPKPDIPPDITAGERHFISYLITDALMINPSMPPFGDVRLRRALSLTIDRARISKQYGFPAVPGGIIPPGMPGHSPDIILDYAPETARRLLIEAGFPGGAGLPAIRGVTSPKNAKVITQITAGWRRELGIQVDADILDDVGAHVSQYSFGFGGWLADYPDPDNFLRQSSFIINLDKMGWRDEQYQALIEQAGSLANRNRRMALYRQLDRMLVAEQALVLPVFYPGVDDVTLVKPWVKRYKTNLLGRILIDELMIERR